MKDLASGSIKNIPQFSEMYKTYNGVEPEKRTAADQMLRDLICKQITNKSKDMNMVENALKIISVSIAVAKEGKVLIIFLVAWYVFFQIQSIIFLECCRPISSQVKRSWQERSGWIFKII